LTIILQKYKRGKNYNLAAKSANSNIPRERYTHTHTHTNTTIVCTKMDRNVVTALMWVRRGFAKAQPKEYELDEAEIEKLKLDPQIKKK
jgi:hypothetical protein